MTDNTLLLQQLMDIKQPEATFWWPLAPGLWLLLLLVPFLLSIIYFFIHRYKPVRREALNELQQLEQQFLATHDITRFAMDITLLLRRVALTKYKQEEVAGLSGIKWLEFLDTHGATIEFSQGIGNILIDIPYQDKKNLRKIKQFNEQALIHLVREWIRSNT